MPRSAQTRAPSSPYSRAAARQPRDCSTRVLPPPAAPTSSAVPGRRPRSARLTSARRSRYHQCRSSSSVSLRTSVPSMLLLVSCGLWSRSGPNVTVADHDPLRRGEFRQAHGPPRVQLLGGDADLGTETELGAVGEGGGGVDGDDGR